MRIETTDASGESNGYLVPLWNVHEQDWIPDQVYLTVIAPHSQKGPHLHKKRCGRFVCIKGNVEIILRRALHPQCPGVYEHQWTGEDHGYGMIEVPPATGAALMNHSDEPAFVINMPTPAWLPDDQDEWPVEEWNP